MILDAFYTYGIQKPLSEAGYFATEKTKRMQATIKDLALGYGTLIAVCGAVGAGKTTFINQLMKTLKQEKKCTISYSYSSDRTQVNIKTLLTALLTDLNKTGKPIKMSSSPEVRDRKFVQLMEENNQPVVLFIDEAQDLHANTLSALKKLSEMAKISQQTLTIILAGQPRLKQMIQSPALDEIGSRAYLIDLDEQAMEQRDVYLQWAITQCLGSNATWMDIITPEAVSALTIPLSTPLQIIYHFNKALALGHTLQVKPLDKRIIDLVLKPKSVVKTVPAGQPLVPRTVGRIIEPVI